MYYVIHIQNPVYYRKFRHIQTYSLILWHTPRTLCKSSKPCHFQNPGAYLEPKIFRTLSRHILTYPERCVTLAYLEPCHIQNFAIFRILAYLHIQAYSRKFNSDSYHNINFLFFTLMVHSFQRTFKRHAFDYNDVNFNARLSLLSNTRSLKIAL